MEKFITHTGVGVPLRRSNVDTDQIIPAVYLKRVTRTGFEDALFAAWRNDPEFVLNQDAYKNGSVLIAGPDFGTGSSREHAVWALKDYGFRVVLAPKFADIFRGNSGKQGLVTGIISKEDCESLWKLLEAEPGTEVTVSLEDKTWRGPVRSRAPSRSMTTCAGRSWKGWTTSPSPCATRRRSRLTRPRVPPSSRARCRRNSYQSKRFCPPATERTAHTGPYLARVGASYVILRSSPMPSILQVEGGHPLHGEITVRGAKNFVPKAMVASLLADTPSELYNVPLIRDTDVVSNLLSLHGVEIDFDQDRGTLRMDTSNVKIASRSDIDTLAGASRIPILFCGPLLHQLGEAFIPELGGCAIGGRPIDFHLDTLRQFGAIIDKQPDGVHIKRPSTGLHGAIIELPLPVRRRD